MKLVETLVQTLTRAPEIVASLVGETPTTLLKHRPAPGKWSIHEHACHLADVHPLFFRRLDTLLREPGCTISSFSPDTECASGRLLEMDLDHALRRFQRDRIRLTGLLRCLTPVQWKIAGEHEEYSRYSVEVMFRHLAMHDHLHAYRIEEILMRRRW